MSLPLLLVVSFAIASTVHAQEADAEASPPPAAATTGDPEISLVELDFRLKPLTRDELVAEADGWVELLKAKIAEISEAQIEALSAEGDAKAELNTTITELQAERAALAERVTAVITALAAKGGDVEAYEQYVAAVTGVVAEVHDVGGAWNAFVAWIKSPEGGIHWAIRLALFLVTLFVAQIVASFVGGATERAIVRVKGTSALLRSFAVNVARKTAFLIGLVVALSMLGLDIGPLVAAIGATGFIVGFALQGTLSNFASGIMILLYRPYDIGNFITAAGISGTVDAMTLVSTTLKLPDNQVVVIPNNSIWGNVITNVTGSENRRVDMTFGIGYDDDLAKAQSVLEAILREHPLVLDEPEPFVKLNALADSSVNFVVRPWAKTSDYFTVLCDVTRSVKERFDAEGISIPYPQRDVHLHQAAGA